MFSKLLQGNIKSPESAPKEGDLYKIVTAFGKTFELRYGYYGEGDRRYDPVIIYPDFRKAPLYTEDGAPFVTVIQDACKNYKSESVRTVDSTCADCKYFRLGEEWIGLCKCRCNKKNE